MLNIYKLKHKPNFYKHSKKGNEIAQTKHYPPANKEWFNSIYAYDKNTIKLLPVADKVILRFLKSYFNLHSPKLEKSVKFSSIRRRKLRKRLRRLSTNRILISRAELKHTSSKVVITVYVYNRQIIYYLRRLERINVKNLNLQKTKKKALYVISRVYKQKKKLLKTLNRNNNIFKNYENMYLKFFFSKCLRRDITFFYYKQIISLNQSKFEKTYLSPLTGLIQKIYNKKIEFNLVNLKHLYLNSSLFSETLLAKIKNKKNRVIKVLKASIRMFQQASLNNIDIFNDMYNRKKKLQNLKVNYLGLENEIKSHEINKITQEVYKKKFLDEDNLEQTESTTKSVFNYIKNKSVTGIRIEAAGRLTRRNTAERSIYKLRYKGNLKNMDSSFKGLSSVLFRGHAKSNVQYTKLKSRRRIGSFGLKGWVSSN